MKPKTIIKYATRGLALAKQTLKHCVCPFPVTRIMSRGNHHS